MTDLVITEVGDAWVNSAPTKTGLNYGSTSRVHVKSGERQGFVLPPLQSIAGRTVLAATLTGRVGSGHVAQTYTVSPVTERWSPGRVTWANKPAVNAGAAVTEVVGSALPDGGLIEVDVTSILASVAAGTEWFGLRISTNSTTAGQSFYSTDSGDPAWELQVTLSDAPDQPSNLRPDGGAVGTNEPILAWDFVDLGGDSTEQAHSQVQVDSPAVGIDPDEVSPDYDSGWVANVDPEYDLSAVTYTPPASPAQSTFWRVRVKDATGLISEWSDWADFTVDSLPTLVVDSPIGPFGDPSPQLLAHLTGGTVSSWKAWVTGPDRSDVRDHTGVQTGAIDWTIPVRNKDGRRNLREDEQGWIHLKVWDDVDRAVAVGESPYLSVWIPATWDDDLGVSAPTGLMVSQLDDGDPRQVWSFNLTEAPTAVVFQVAGDTFERVELEDLSVSGGNYSWTDSGQVPPLRPRTLGVRVVDGSSRSKAATIVEHSHTVSGVWLIPEDTDIAPVVLAGTAVDGFVRTDRVATYVPLNGEEVDVIYDTPLRTGTFEGTVDSRQDVWEALDTIAALLRSRTRKARMIWGSQSILVRLRDPDATSHSEITAANLMHVVRFGFVQVGE